MGTARRAHATPGDARVPISLSELRRASKNMSRGTPGNTAPWRQLEEKPAPIPSLAGVSCARRKPQSCVIPRENRADARRSKENTRHSGLDPESRIVNLRRAMPQKIPLPPLAEEVTQRAGEWERPQKNQIDKLDSGSSLE
jgi:hypothetical protein